MKRNMSMYMVLIDWIVLQRWLRSFLNVEIIEKDWPELYAPIQIAITNILDLSPAKLSASAHPALRKEAFYLVNT